MMKPGARDYRSATVSALGGSVAAGWASAELSESVQSILKPTLLRLVFNTAALRAHRPHIILWILLVAIFTSITSTASAATLTGELVSKSVTMRDGGLIPMEFRLQYDGSGFQEGRLEVEIMEGGEVLSRTRSQELVITPGKRLVSLLVSPLANDSANAFYARMRFIAKEKTWELGDHLFNQRGLGKTTFVIGMIGTERTLTAVEDEWQRSMRVESVHPKYFTEFSVSITVTDRLEVEQMPIRPLDYCRFDIVSLNAVGFAAAKEKQLDALLRWVKAGGSVCVCTDGVELAEDHTKFLARLSGWGKADSKDPSDAFTRHYVELGRAVIISQPLTSEILNSNSWKAAAGFLWKLKNELVATIEREGDPGSIEKPKNNYSNYWGSGKYAHTYTIMRLMDQMAMSRGDFLTQIPAWTIFAILGGFLILIGPGDYFILGWLRRRRWTWVVFFILCVTCTWGISALAEYYLGSADRRQIIQLVDLSTDGRVLREVRYEMSLTARNRVLQTTVKSGIAVQMKNDYNQSRRQMTTALATSEWQTASSQSLYQPANQWTISTIRSTAFPEAIDDTGIEWQRLILNKHGDKLRLDASEIPNKAGWEFHPNSNPKPNDQNWTPANYQNAEALMCQAPAGSIHKILTQQSPHLDPVLGDLALENLSRNGWTHVIAVRKTDDGLQVYRRPVKLEVRP